MAEVRVDDMDLIGWARFDGDEWHAFRYHGPHDWAFTGARIDRADLIKAMGRRGYRPVYASPHGEARS